MAMAVTYTNFCGRVVAENRGGAQRAYVRDTIGSTIALLDSTQTVTDTIQYWPFGEIAERTGTNPTPLTYVGTLGYYQGILTMLYIRARILVAQFASWMTVDPVWPKRPSYQYAANRPIDRTDPSGLSPEGVCCQPPVPDGGCKACVDDATEVFTGCMAIAIAGASIDAGICLIACGSFGPAFPACAAACALAFIEDLIDLIALCFILRGIMDDKCVQTQCNMAHQQGLWPLCCGQHQE